MTRALRWLARRQIAAAIVEADSEDRPFCWYDSYTLRDFLRLRD